MARPRAGFVFVMGKRPARDLIVAEHLGRRAIERAVRRGDVSEGQYSCKWYDGHVFAWFNGPSWRGLRALCREMRALGFASISVDRAP